MFFFGTLTEINVIHIEVLPPIVLVHVKDQWCRVPQKNAPSNPRKKHDTNGFSCLRKSEMFVDPMYVWLLPNPHHYCSGQLHFGFDANADGRLLFLCFLMWQILE